MAQPPYMNEGYDMRTWPEWMRKAATDPEGEFNDWLSNYRQQRDEALRAEEKQRDAARYAETQAKYNEYMKNRGNVPVTYGNASGPNGEWFNDYSLRNGAYTQGPATQGNTFEDWRNQGTQDYRRLAREDMPMPFDPRVADASFSGQNPATQTPYAYTRSGLPLPPGAGGRPVTAPDAVQAAPPETPQQVYDSVFPSDNPMPFRAGDMFGGATYDAVPGRPGALRMDLAALLAALKRLQFSTGGTSPLNAPWTGPRR